MIKWLFTFCIFSCFALDVVDRRIDFQSASEREIAIDILHMIQSPSDAFIARMEDIAQLGFPQPEHVIDGVGMWELNSFPLLDARYVCKDPVTILTQPYTKKGDYWFHSDVVRSYMNGLIENRVCYSFNPESADGFYPNVIVTINEDALRDALALKDRGTVDRVVVGPNFSWRGDRSLARAGIDQCVVPSKWVEQMHAADAPEIKERIAVCPCGIDADYWAPDMGTFRKHVLVYEKPHYGEFPSKDFTQRVVELLERQGHTVRVITYGSYNHESYRQLLWEAKFAVFLSAFESQGLALAEAWGCDVPTLVWNPKKIAYMGGFDRASSCPYLTTAQGAEWESLEKLDLLVRNWNTTECHPRKWVLRNMTDQICAYHLLTLFGKE